jgi:hypothetical protein
LASKISNLEGNWREINIWKAHIGRKVWAFTLYIKFSKKLPLVSKEKYNHVLTISLFLPLLFDNYFQAEYLELLMLGDYHHLCYM